MEIQAALDSLPESGGEIVILDGTYLLKNYIFVNKPNTLIKGNGLSTILKMNFYSSYVSKGCLTLNSNNITVENLTICGNHNIYYGFPTGIMIYSNHCTVNHVKVYDAPTGVFADNTECVNISFLNLEDTVTFAVNSKHAVVSQCLMQGGQMSISGSNLIITGNTLISTGRDCTCINCHCENSIISNNIFISEYDTIKTYSINNLFLGNILIGSDYVDEGTNNTFVNNKVIETTE